MIKIGSSGFRSKLGWSSNTYVEDIQLFSPLLFDLQHRKRIFEILGFYESSDDQTLNPPTTDPSTPEGVQNRRKLLRAWVEVNAWLADFKRNNRMSYLPLTLFFVGSLLSCSSTRQRSPSECTTHWYRAD